MVGSLSKRIVVLCAILCFCMALLAGLLFAGSSQMRESLAWVTHSEQVLNTANRSLSHLQQAESGQRGFILTRNPEFAEAVDTEAVSARGAVVELDRLTGDNPAQNARAKHVRALVNQRADLLAATMRLARNGDFSGAQAVTATGRGRNLMQLVDARVGDLLNEERALAISRMATVEKRLNYIRWLVMLGTPAIVVIIALMGAALIQRIRRPVDEMMTVMGQLGAGDRSARVVANMDSSEFERLANGYNAMADELVHAVADQVDSQERLRVANLELSANTHVLRERGEVIELLGGMAHRMQAARTDDELASIIRVFVPRVLPEIPGALYAHNNSRNLLVPIAALG